MVRKNLYREPVLGVDSLAEHHQLQHEEDDQGAAGRAGHTPGRGSIRTLGDDPGGHPYALGTGPWVRRSALDEWRVRHHPEPETRGGQARIERHAEAEVLVERHIARGEGE